ncbi:unnamed protein product [Urochloa humidicola]
MSMTRVRHGLGGNVQTGVTVCLCENVELCMVLCIDLLLACHGHLQLQVQSVVSSVSDGQLYFLYPPQWLTRAFHCIHLQIFLFIITSPATTSGTSLQLQVRQDDSSIAPSKTFRFDKTTVPGVSELASFSNPYHIPHVLLL